jgi:hypothetical protein
MPIQTPALLPFQLQMVHAEACKLIQPMETISSAHVLCLQQTLIATFHGLEPLIISIMDIHHERLSKFFIFRG